MSRDLRKPDFCVCENKGADQLRGNRKADQRLCFRYTNSTIPLLPKPGRKSKDRFSDLAAHIIISIILSPYLIWSET